MQLPILHVASLRLPFGASSYPKNEQLDSGILYCCDLHRHRLSLETEYESEPQFPPILVKKTDKTGSHPLHTGVIQMYIALFKSVPLTHCHHDLCKGTTDTILDLPSVTCILYVQSTT